MDPTFPPPWSHDARGFELRYQARFDPEPYGRALAATLLCVWEYEDAHRRGEPDAADAARRAFHRVAAEVRADGLGDAVEMALGVLADAAATTGDLDGLAADILDWHPSVDTADLEDDDRSSARAAARTFVSCCTAFLGHPASVDHGRKDEVDEALTDVAERIAGVLTVDQKNEIRMVRQRHGAGAELRRLAETSRSAGAVTGGLLPAVPRLPSQRASWQWPAAGDRAIVRRIRRGEAAIAAAKSGAAPARLGDALRDLVDLLTTTDLAGARFVRLATAVADAAYVLGETQNDAAALDAAADRLAVAGPGHPHALPSLAHLVRAYARLAADADGDLDNAIAELRRAREAEDRLAPSLGPDVRAMLAWLAVCRTPADLDDSIRACALVRSALSGLPCAADVVLARLLLWRALALEGPSEAQVADLRQAVELVGPHCGRGRSGCWQAELIRINARNALEAATGREKVIKQALRWHDAAKASASSSTTDQARVALAWVAWAVGTNWPVVAAEAYDHLMAIVPHDAGVRYRPEARDLVLAQAQEHTEEAGFWLARAGRYRDAAVALETGRAVALGMAGDDEAVVGDVTYDDITAATEDGTIVYLAAAKGGGYALIVAGTYDPQYVELPRLDRAAVEELRSLCLPDVLDAPTRGTLDRGLRLLWEESIPGDAPTSDTLTQGLELLWEKGIRDLVLLHARGHLLTVVPIGQLSLLPLHAAGVIGPPDDERRAWQHAGNFSAIRYAPNARMLRRCRATAAALDDDALTMLVADVPAAPGWQSLDHVGLEAAAAAAPWHGRAQVEHQCTWERFRAAAEAHPVWHLASHAAGSPYATEKSVLAFADGEVTLEKLRGELAWAPRRLVVLSACETNLSGVTLPNEVVGFPSTLLQLGFAGAIATAWRVDDQASTYLMARFHQLWRGERQHPAAALRGAQRWLRHATRADLAAVLPGTQLPPGDAPHPYLDPWFWAAFAYTGA